MVSAICDDKKEKTRFSHSRLVNVGRKVDRSKGRSILYGKLVLIVSQLLLTAEKSQNNGFERLTKELTEVHAIRELLVRSSKWRKIYPCSWLGLLRFHHHQNSFFCNRGESDFFVVKRSGIVYRIAQSRSKSVQ